MATDLPTKRIKKITVSIGNTYDIVPEMLQNSGQALKAPTLSKDETIATESFVNAAIEALPEPMIFKGSVGTGGTIEWANLPAAAAANEGFTYKVITDHATAPVCKEGDTIISNGSAWVIIPSGDEPSGTVTSVGISMPTGFAVTGSPVTSSGTMTVTYASGYSMPTDAKQAEWDAKQDGLIVNDFR